VAQHERLLRSPDKGAGPSLIERMKANEDMVQQLADLPERFTQLDASVKKSITEAVVQSTTGEEHLAAILDRLEALLKEPPDGRQG